MLLADLMQRAADLGASDVHLKAGSPPALRVDGAIRLLTDMPALTPETTRDLAIEILDRQEWAEFEERGDIDVCSTEIGSGRFRVHAAMELGVVGLSLRRLPGRVPSFAELGMPAAIKDLCRSPSGLVMVTGRFGSGKSTALASMTEFIAETRRCHIVTIQDPVEYVHQDKNSLVTHREIGRDCTGYADAIQRALRHDVDVLVLGDLPDLPTIRQALAAAEGGCLVLAGFNAKGSVRAIRRIFDLHPEEERSLVRLQLAESLQGIVFQCLVPLVGGGRAPVREVLTMDDRARGFVREGRMENLLEVLRVGNVRVSSLEHELARLVVQSKITIESAMAQSCDQDELRALLQNEIQAEIRDAGLDSLAEKSLQGAGSSY